MFKPSSTQSSKMNKQPHALEALQALKPSKLTPDTLQTWGKARRWSLHVSQRPRFANCARIVGQGHVRSASVALQGWTHASRCVEQRTTHRDAVSQRVCRLTEATAAIAHFLTSAHQRHQVTTPQGAQSAHLVACLVGSVGGRTRTRSGSQVSDRARHNVGHSLIASHAAWGRLDSVQLARQPHA